MNNKKYYIVEVVGECPYNWKPETYCFNSEAQERAGQVNEQRDDVDNGNLKEWLIDHDCMEKPLPHPFRAVVIPVNTLEEVYLITGSETIMGRGEHYPDKIVDS